MSSRGEFEEKHTEAADGLQGELDRRSWGGVSLAAGLSPKKQAPLCIDTPNHLHPRPQEGQGDGYLWGHDNPGSG